MVQVALPRPRLISPSLTIYVSLEGTQSERHRNVIHSNRITVNCQKHLKAHRNEYDKASTLRQLKGQTTKSRLAHHSLLLPNPLLKALAVRHHPRSLTYSRHRWPSSPHHRGPSILTRKLLLRRSNHATLHVRLHGRQLRDSSATSAVHDHLLLLRSPCLLHPLHPHRSLHHRPRLLLLQTCLHHWLLLQARLHHWAHQRLLLLLLQRQHRP